MQHEKESRKKETKKKIDELRTAFPADLTPLVFVSFGGSQPPSFPVFANLINDFPNGEIRRKH